MLTFDEQLAAVVLMKLPGMSYAAMPVPRPLPTRKGPYPFLLVRGSHAVH